MDRLPELPDGVFTCADVGDGVCADQRGDRTAAPVLQLQTRTSDAVIEPRRARSSDRRFD